MKREPQVWAGGFATVGICTALAVSDPNGPLNVPLVLFGAFIGAAIGICVFCALHVIGEWEHRREIKRRHRSVSNRSQVVRHRESA